MKRYGAEKGGRAMHAAGNAGHPLPGGALATAPAPVPSVPCAVVVRRILFCECGCSDIVHDGAKNRGPCVVHPGCAAFSAKGVESHAA